ncbi:hypothetical protein O0235_10630 [Tepidiforma flava]|uniref:ABC transmembrane type-1 domain-containing protein n=1 Tax=Tepidiforma flava TaxID=3004094 RepID=A0ABY7M3W5_9CHLR|nr:hypothetical protein [Tepidiforma flava]WBL35241.1 hypothetical protein O0235_10630 [Tepidiforma flava]
MLPNVAAPIIVIASIQVGNAILAEAALSFLALGIADAAHPSWGGMLQEMRQVWLEAWWTAVVPGAAISIAVLAFNLFGDALPGTCSIQDCVNRRNRNGESQRPLLPNQGKGQNHGETGQLLASAKAEPPDRAARDGTGRGGGRDDGAGGVRRRGR